MVPVHLESRVTAVGDDSVVVENIKYGKRITIDADSVIVSAGYNPAPIAKKGAHVHVIGDAKKVGNLRTVIWGAWDTAMKI